MRRWSLLRWPWALLLAVSVAAVYHPAFQFGFIELDDPVYVSNEPRILSGLSFENAWWALTNLHGAHWLPVTDWSLQLDASLGGGDPRWLHVTNVLLHSLNAILLYLFLDKATGRRAWAWAWAAAALWALHPLRVESVAWITERRDVLSGLFGLLALHSYAAFSRSGKRSAWLLTAGWLILGLGSKSSLVVWPLVLWLIDDWPLRRSASFKQRLAEKLPLLAMSAALSVTALLALKKMGYTHNAMPWLERLPHVVLAYWQSLVQFVWPMELSVSYPYAPIDWLLWTAAALGLAGVYVLGHRFRREAPAVWTGLLWYGVAMAPTSGLVQSGGQLTADHFSYLPHMGLSLAAAGLAEKTWSLLRFSLPGKGAVTGAALGCLALLSFRQVWVWKDAEALYDQALQVDPDNAWIHNGYGILWANRGDTEKAEAHWSRALELSGMRDPWTISMLGLLWFDHGQRQRGAAFLERGYQLAPKDPDVAFGWGDALVQLGRPKEALEVIDLWRGHDRVAKRLACSRAYALAELGLVSEAHTAFETCLATAANLPQTRLNWALAWANGKNTAEATAAFEEARKLHPTSPLFLEPPPWAGAADAGVGFGVPP